MERFKNSEDYSFKLMRGMINKTFLILMFLFFSISLVSSWGAVSNSGVVQRGVVNMTGLLTTNITLSPVNTTRTIVLLSTMSTEDNPGALRVTGYISNGTNLVLTRGSTSLGDPVVSYEVVESPSFNVQRGELQTSATSTSSMNIDISQVNLNRSFIILESRINTATSSNMVRTFWTAEFMNSTRFNVTRGVTGSNVTVSWQVVQFIGSTVQSGLANLTGFSLNVDLPNEVNTSQSFIYMTSRDSGTRTQGAYITSRASFINGSRIAFYRSGFDSINWNGISYFVVSSSQIRTQTGFIAINSTDLVTRVINPINLTASFSLSSSSYSSVDTSFSRAFVTRSLINSTAINLQKLSGVSTANVDWFISSFTGPDSSPQVNLVSPADQFASNSFNNSFVCNASEDSLFGVGLQNVTLRLWNATGLIMTNTTNLTGFSNQTSLSLNISTDGTYLWNCQFFNNDSTPTALSASSNFTLYVSTNSPATNLNSPLNNIFSNEANPYFNFTSSDSNGISSCSIYSNFTGTWGLNKTYFNITSGVQSAFRIPLSDNTYKWNVECNDTTNNKAFSANNFTVSIDTVKPLVENVNITTNQGSQTFSFSFNSSDNNLVACFYSVLNSTGGVDSSTNANQTISCNSAGNSETPSAFGSYNLIVYANDSAGNINSSTISFILSQINPGGGGGGGGVSVTEVPKIAIIQPTNLREFNELARAIIFSRMFEACGSDASKISTCTLDSLERVNLAVNITKQNVKINTTEVTIFLKNFNLRLFEEVFIAKEVADRNFLYIGVIDVKSTFQVVPKFLDKFFLAFSDSFEQIITSNKNLKSCEVIKGLGIECKIVTNSSAMIKYTLPNSITATFSTVEGQISYTNKQGENTFQDIRIRVIRPTFSAIASTIGVIVVFTLIYINRKRLRKNINNLGKSRGK